MAFKMGLLGKKIGMTQQFNQKGEWVPLCVIETGPCVVLEVKTPERNGYSSIQIGFGEKSERRTNKPEAGKFAKAQCTPKQFVKEIRLEDQDVTQFKVGQTLNVGQVFSPGDIIDAIGISKGKGFQGVMKRYHFSGFRATHGTHEYFRHGGSVGCRLTPGHVHRGKRMPGQMGNKRITVQNIRVVDVIPEKNLLLLRGGVPGPANSYLMIKQAIKRPYWPLQLRNVEPATTAASPE